LIPVEDVDAVIVTTVDASVCALLAGSTAIPTRAQHSSRRSPGASPRVARAKFERGS
jgi:hypothetical protein